MRQNIIILFFIAIVCLTSYFVDAKDPPKNLQVGIKNRIPDGICRKRTKNGDSITVHYTGTLFEDGKEFDSSIPRGTPFTFTLGGNQVIKGWDQGLHGMCIGEKRKLIIPSDLGYGPRGNPPLIPANAALVFDVELVGIGKNRYEL
ncbi:5229_t:CDS:2 [Funneliformis geosporum]|uniref:peptidylprolyl isomerase n=1 Tax=Funneliformis geosporum TaxID=1117311 RepID=A0A9W4SW14_9GLOM|nr:799_t:CDS:2 [Funneliformis geosporum]CAI2189395.1 5229_t:CDS:2 [Funneliformis geosporum]